MVKMVIILIFLLRCYCTYLYYLTNGASVPWPSTGDQPHLAVGAANSLQAYDPVTGFRKWFITFNTPPIAAYSSNGNGRNRLKRRSQDVPLALTQKDDAHPEEAMVPGSKVGPRSLQALLNC